MDLKEIKELVGEGILKSTLEEKQKNYLDTIINIKNIEPIIEDAENDLKEAEALKDIPEKDKNSAIINAQCHLDGSVQNKKVNEKALPVHKENILFIKEVLWA